jgi:hypothetical protein
MGSGQEAYELRQQDEKKSATHMEYPPFPRQVDLKTIHDDHFKKQLQKYIDNGLINPDVKNHSDTFGYPAQDKPDMVNLPPHYTSGEIECIDAIKVATKDLRGIEAVCVGNIIKYIWRCKRKNGKQDLEKAQWYLAHLIKNYE